MEGRCSHQVAEIGFVRPASNGKKDFSLRREMTGIMSSRMERGISSKLNHYPILTLLEG